MPNIPIYTIQFLDIPFNERDQFENKERRLFLNFITKHVFEIALKNQSLFKAIGCDAEYFHDDQNFKNKIPKIINCFIKDEVLTIRAYTKNGIETLKFWYQLYQKEHPQNCINVRFSKETYQLILEKEPIHHYISHNWIAFDKVIRKDNQYYEIIKTNAGKIENLKVFENVLRGNIGEFLDNIGIVNDYKGLITKLNYIPITHKNIIAIKKGKENVVRLFCFEIKFTTNYKLPSLFSLGKKKALGTGVFVKDSAKTISYDLTKINLKPNQME